MILSLRILQNMNGTERLQALVRDVAGIDEDGVPHVDHRRMAYWVDVKVYRYAEWEMKDGEVVTKD